MFWRRMRLGAAMLVVLTASCARFRTETDRPDKAPEGPSNGNIAAMLLAANNTDISYAKLVPDHTTNSAVRDYAARMITDHAAVNTAVTELIARTSIEPQENTASLSYRDESTANRALLRRLVGRQFDSTYIANEIAFHTKLLRTLDTMMIPKAQDGQLRQILVLVRPAVSAHLDHAQRLQATLK